MPRKITVRTADFPYHITARCINRDWFRLPLETVWEIFSDWLAFVRHGFGLRIHSFVLMTNHFHLIASTPESNIDKCMNYFMREVSRSITLESDRINQTFGGPYHWSLIQTETYFYNVYKYVYMNPVAANLTNRCEDYPYSTLPGLLGLNSLSIPVEADSMLNGAGAIESTLSWLNEAPTRPQDFEDIRKGLRKSIFELKKDRATLKSHRLTSVLL